MSKINESEISRRLERLSRIEPTPTATGRAIQRVRDALIKEQQSPKVRIWRMIWKSPITRLAAAAVIIVAIGFFAVHQGPDEQSETAGILEASKSPAEMLTLASINAAYRKGELEAVENRYERVLEMMEPWPSKISIQELFEELNGS